MSTTLLQVTGAVAGYGAAEHILKGADITVAAREIVTIIGPNGAGKSTLLKTVAGLVPLKAGQITMAGADVTRANALGRAAAGISFVPQEHNVFGTLSVEENLSISAFTAPAEQKRRVQAAFERYPLLAQKRRALARTLSGGQRQILAMAMGLMTAPQLLLLDEPTAGLSPQAAEQLFDAIVQLHQEGMPILMVEQHALEALEISTRGYVILPPKGRARNWLKTPKPAACFWADKSTNNTTTNRRTPIVSTTPHLDAIHLNRRRLLQLGAVAVGSFSGLATWAQSAAPVVLGAVLPLTGAGGPYGPVMAKVIQAVVDEVNAAGGVHGRTIQLLIEDSQTNPEAGVRAARKLVEVNKVSAILGTWASSVTTAIAPLCWESKTFLISVSGADAITRLPHRGYLVRTQPNTTVQGQKFGEFAVGEGIQRIVFVSPQTPFADIQFAEIQKKVEGAGGAAKALIYDDKRPSYRSEIDDILRFKPDAIVFGGYMPDTTIMLKDLYRAGYAGKKIAFAYAVNQKVVESLPNDVVEGIVTIAPSPAQGSNAYTRVAQLVGVANPDPYTAQVYDQINLLVLALAAGGAPMNGDSIRQALRGVSQGAGGVKVDNALDGLKRLAQHQTIDYDGASGPCDFTDTGDIIDCQFRYEQVRAGKLELLRIA